MFITVKSSVWTGSSLKAFFFVARCLCFIIRDGFHTQVWFAQTQLVCRLLRAACLLCASTLLQSNCFHLPTTSDVDLHVFDKVAAHLLVCFCCVVSALSFNVEIVAGLGTFQSSTGHLFKKLAVAQRWKLKGGWQLAQYCICKIHWGIAVFVYPKLSCLWRPWIGLTLKYVCCKCSTSNYFL